MASPVLAPAPLAVAASPASVAAFAVSPVVVAVVVAVLAASPVVVAAFVASPEPVAAAASSILDFLAIASAQHPAGIPDLDYSPFSSHPYLILFYSIFPKKQ